MVEGGGGMVGKVPSDVLNDFSCPFIDRETYSLNFISGLYANSPHPSEGGDGREH